MRRPKLHPGLPMPKRPSLDDLRRFLSKPTVDHASPLVRGEHCWKWQGATDSKGYGQIKIAGRAHWAHRVAYQMFRSRIRAGQDVDHICHNRSCVNPAHLRATSRELNSSRNQVPATVGGPIPF